MRHMIFFFMLVTVSQTSWSQHLIGVTGTVIKSASRDPIPFANIHLQNSGIGTAANQEGKFLLRLDSAFVNSSLVISCVGYQSTIIKVSDLKPDMTVVLVENPIQLYEVTVTPFDATGTMIKVIDNLKRNYKAPPNRLDAFYRTSFQIDMNFKRLLEAAVSIADTRGTLYGQRKIEIREIRKTRDTRSDPWKTYDGYLNDLVNNHPLQNPWWAFLDKGKLGKFYITMDESRLQDSETYSVVTLEPKKKSADLPYTATLIIRESNSAIVDIIIHWKPELQGNFSMAWEKRADQKFVATFQQSHYAYQQYNGFYYLKSAEWDRVGEVIRIAGNNVLYTTESYDELLVTNIETGKSDIKPNSPNSDVYEIADVLSYHPQFWSTYNRPVDSQRFIKGKEEMEKTENLEQQFEKYTGQKPSPKKK